MKFPQVQSNEIARSCFFLSRYTYWNFGGDNQRNERARESRVVGYIGKT